MFSHADLELIDTLLAEEITAARGAGEECRQLVAESVRKKLAHVVTPLPPRALAPKCPHCGCANLDELAIVETFRGYHYILRVADKVYLESPLSTKIASAYERFNEGAGDYQVLCNACATLSAPSAAGLGPSTGWEWE